MDVSEFLRQRELLARQWIIPHVSEEVSSVDNPPVGDGAYRERSHSESEVDNVREVTLSERESRELHPLGVNPESTQPYAAQTSSVPPPSHATQTGNFELEDSSAPLRDDISDSSHAVSLIPPDGLGMSQYLAAENPPPSGPEADLLLFRKVPLRWRPPPPAWSTHKATSDETGDETEMRRQRMASLQQALGVGRTASSLDDAAAADGQGEAEAEVKREEVRPSMSSKDRFLDARKRRARLLRPPGKLVKRGAADSLPVSMRRGVLAPPPSLHPSLSASATFLGAYVLTRKPTCLCRHIKGPAHAASCPAGIVPSVEQRPHGVQPSHANGKSPNEKLWEQWLLHYRQGALFDRPYFILSGARVPAGSEVKECTSPCQVAPQVAMPSTSIGGAVVLSSVIGHKSRRVQKNAPAVNLYSPLSDHVALLRGGAKGGFAKLSSNAQFSRFLDSSGNMATHSPADSELILQDPLRSPTAKRMLDFHGQTRFAYFFMPPLHHLLYTCQQAWCRFVLSFAREVPIIARHLVSRVQSELENDVVFDTNPVDSAGGDVQPPHHPLVSARDITAWALREFQAGYPHMTRLLATFKRRSVPPLDVLRAAARGPSAMLSNVAPVLPAPKSTPWQQLVSLFVGLLNRQATAHVDRCANAACQSQRIIERCTLRPNFAEPSKVPLSLERQESEDSLANMDSTTNMDVTSLAQPHVRIFSSQQPTVAMAAQHTEATSCIHERCRRGAHAGDAPCTCQWCRTLRAAQLKSEVNGSGQTSRAGALLVRPSFELVDASSAAIVSFEQGDAAGDRASIGDNDARERYSQTVYDWERVEDLISSVRESLKHALRRKFSTEPLTHPSYAWWFSDPPPTLFFPSHFMGRPLFSHSLTQRAHRSNVSTPRWMYDRNDRNTYPVFMPMHWSQGIYFCPGAALFSAGNRVDPSQVSNRHHNIEGDGFADARKRVYVFDDVNGRCSYESEFAFYFDWQSADVSGDEEVDRKRTRKRAQKQEMAASQRLSTGQRNWLRRLTTGNGGRVVGRRRRKIQDRSKRRAPTGARSRTTPLHGNKSNPQPENGGNGDPRSSIPVESRSRSGSSVGPYTLTTGGVIPQLFRAPPGKPGSLPKNESVRSDIRGYQAESRVVRYPLLVRACLRKSVWVVETRQFRYHSSHDSDETGMAQCRTKMTARPLGVSLAYLMYPRWYGLEDIPSLYSPDLLDGEMKSGAHRVVTSMPAMLTSLSTFVKRRPLQDSLNKEFRLRHEWVHPSLSLSKIRRVKQITLDCVLELDLELSTGALAYAYFERLVLLSMIQKFNRRVAGAVCLLLAFKFNENPQTRENEGLQHYLDTQQRVHSRRADNDGGGTTDAKGSESKLEEEMNRDARHALTNGRPRIQLSKAIACMARRFDVAKKEILASEFPVFSALGLDLHVSSNSYRGFYRWFREKAEEEGRFESYLDVSWAVK